MPGLVPIPHEFMGTSDTDDHDPVRRAAVFAYARNRGVPIGAAQHALRCLERDLELEELVECVGRVSDRDSVSFSFGTVAL